MEIAYSPLDTGTDATDNHLSVEDPLSEDLRNREDMRKLRDLEDMEVMDDLEDPYEDYDDEADVESLTDETESLTDDMANALEELENEAEDEDGDKIIVEPVRAYENADTMKNAIYRENRKKPGIYR